MFLFNKIVQELLSSTGGTFNNPSTNYYQIERDTLKLSENVAQVFMGMRLQCAHVITTLSTGGLWMIISLLRSSPKSDGKMHKILESDRLQQGQW